MWPHSCHWEERAISSQAARCQLSWSMKDCILERRAVAGMECLSWIEPPLPRNMSGVSRRARGRVSEMHSPE